MISHRCGDDVGLFSYAVRHRLLYNFINQVGKSTDSFRISVYIENIVNVDKRKKIGYSKIMEQKSPDTMFSQEREEDIL